MHFHHYTLCKIAELIRQEALGAILCEAFTQEKDQVMIGLGMPGQDFYLRVACAAPLPYIWPMRQGHKAKKNVLALFQEAYGQALVGVQAVPWERVLLLNFEHGYTLVLKMHGIISNVMLMQSGKVLERFRHNFGPDLDFIPQPGQFDLEWRSSASHGEGLPTLDRLKMISPIFEKRFAARTEHWMQAGLEFEDAFQKLLDEIQDNRFYLVRAPQKLAFQLFPSEEYPSQEFSDIRTALDVFLRNWYQYDSYARLHVQTRKSVDKQLNRVQGLLKSSNTTIHKISTERPPEEFGHLLMANLHVIETGMESIELLDFYNDRQLVLKLKPELNGQQNAEEYYNKQKKHKARVRYLEGHILLLEAELLVWMEADESFSRLPNPQDLPYSDAGIDPKPARELAAFIKEYGHRLSEGSTNEEVRKHPFLEFACMGYTILVGKNAKQNDLLTFQYSKKNDIWLHARDAFGSHVIVRNPSDRDLPAPVLEYAAGLAARHSKRKHEGLVPVQYTPRKYIRKVKNGAAGQVIVEREKVLMIEPLPEN
jgi:predicted ribosome quality control (RQC) complex YloA/Tae2 family protein